MSNFVINEPTRSCCGQPSRTPCSCRDDAQKREPLGLPTMNFESPTDQAVGEATVTNNCPQGGIGVPEWRFDSQPAAGNPVANRSGQSDKPEPLGIPAWTF